MGLPKPKVGNEITVELTGERTRAEIIKVMSPTTVIAKLLRYTTSRDHGRHKGDLVACRFEEGALGLSEWRVLKERELGLGKMAKVEPQDLSMG